MYLKQIQITGFKSFAQSVSIPLHAQRTAIVGPNGCGKSNVVDAIRWVIGENSSKLLRAGQSLDEVIFKGTKSRKPANKASVELSFDNSAQTLHSQYNRYHEIAVKRTITSDGQSTYYFNGTKCRRKDIVELFLGTGLGPRSYAIIEQNTISHIVQAKPEDIRQYIEEASGVSRYKERRKETEQRLNNTEQNLQRLNDLLQEVTQRVQGLQQQAERAQQYRELKTQKRLLSAKRQVLQWQAIEHSVRQQQQIEDRHGQAVQDKQRQQQQLRQQLNDIHHAVGSLHSQIEQDQEQDNNLVQSIAQLEQQIAQQQQKAQQLQQQWDELQSNLQEVASQQGDDSLRLHQIETELNTLASHHAQQNEAWQQAREQWHKLKDQQKYYQRYQEQYQKQLNEKNSQLDYESKQIKQLKSRLESIDGQLEQLSARYASYDIESLQHQCQQLAEQASQQQVRAQDLHEQKQSAQSKLNELYEKQKAHERAQREVQDNLSQWQAEYQSLATLQHHALKANDQTINRWLAGSQNQLSRLGELVSVDAQWQQALEQVVGHFLSSLCVASLDDWLVSAHEWPASPLVLMEADHDSRAKPGTLAALVTAASQYLLPWLNSVYTASDLANAMASRHQLRDGESMITPEGIWLGRNWLMTPADSQVDSGIIQRQQRMQELDQVIKDQQAKLKQCEQTANHLNRDIEHSKQQLEAISQRSHEQQQALQRAHTAHQSKRQQLDDWKHYQQYLSQDWQQATQQRQDTAAALQNAQHNHQQLEQQTEALNQQYHHYQDQWQQCQDQLKQIESRCHQLQSQCQTTNQQYQKLENERQAIHNMHQRIQQRYDRLQQQQHQLQTAWDQLVNTDQWQQQLEAQRHERQKYQERIDDAKSQLQTYQRKQQTLKQQLEEVEQALEHHREQWQTARLEHHSLTVQKQQIETELAASDYSYQQLTSMLAETDSEQTIQPQLNQIDQKLEALGTVNLAAESEYEQALARQQYLQNQVTDLQNAMDTLRQAINQIDQHTRTSFHHTLNQASQFLQHLFPRIFDGGTAYLRLTSNDLLTAGVEIVCQPPGKKAHSVQLLSGGEKALTALALVFALFQLNPAPFCVLDEVDASLDDVNVKRFGDLLMEMSRQVQFLIISHNQQTMASVENLVGVTMRDPGVSTLVTVNIDKAMTSVQQTSERQQTE